MLYCDNLIEYGAPVILRNFNTNSHNTAKDVWSAASSAYGIYSVPYETRLMYGHWYYARYTYKYATTNQRPSWANFYHQGGMATIAISSGTLNPGTEYTFSGVNTISNGSTQAYSNTSGTIYNGPSNSIAGVSSQVKNVLLYDVTQLYQILKMHGVVSTTTQLKSWCDTNLEYQPKGVNYDITALLPSSGSTVKFNDGVILANEFVEPDGMRSYAINNNVKNYPYLESHGHMTVYNNKSNGTVTFTDVSASTQNSPFYPKHANILKITTNGEATPGAGGFVCSHNAAANKIFIERFIAKVPVGYTVVPAYNSQGTGSSVTMITSNKGTGKWEEYAVLYKCGSSGSFSSGGYVYISGSNNQSVTWYLAYCGTYDITDKEYLKDYSVLKNKIKLNANRVFASCFNLCDLITNGDFSNPSATMGNALAAGWTLDTEDYAGEAKCSIVQGVNKGAAYIYKFVVDPMTRYKLSYWVKCKGDMTSYLSAVEPLINGSVIQNNNIVYTNGTKTSLTRQLVAGDTEIKVKSNANWTTSTASTLGFRSSQYNSFWNDLGTYYGSSQPVVAGVSGTDTILLKSPYTGSTIPSGTYIVESFTTSTWNYPTNKAQLPTDNTWRYVEGYFGTENIMYDGSNAYSQNSIPFGVREIQLFLNIYANNGTVPIKYSDIKLEAVSGNSQSRTVKLIQIDKR